MEARERTLELGGRRLAAQEWDAGAGGTPLLVLWGAEHHEQWSRIAGRLAEERRVVAVRVDSVEEAAAAADALGLAYCAVLGTAEAGTVTYGLVAHAPGRVERVAIVDAVIEGLVNPDPDDIIVPLLLIHGAASPVSLTEMRRVAEQVEGATLVEIQSLAHPLPEGNPQALVQTLRDFLG